jgi:hypothetical protein
MSNSACNNSCNTNCTANCQSSADGSTASGTTAKEELAKMYKEAFPDDPIHDYCENERMKTLGEPKKKMTLYQLLMVEMFIVWEAPQMTLSQLLLKLLKKRLLIL